MTWADQFSGATIGSLNKKINKMNKNPKRHKDIDRTISQLLNPKETQSQKNKRIKKEINEMIKW
jgi:hypothetical protein